MKAEILKIAGVKSEKEFYKKFPTEEAFMKAHGKDFKKAKLGKVMPNAQYGCKGQSCTQTGEGMTKEGSGLGLGNPYVAGGVDPSFVDYKALNAPLSWEELQKFNDINPKSKEFKTYFKDLKNKYPNLTVEQLLAASGDSARINLRKQNLKRYDQPSEQTYDKAYHPFYRNLMNQPQRVTIPQVLDVQPGGYSGFEQNVRSNYGKKKGKEGSQVKKLKQLTSFEEDIDGMMPKAQPGLTMPQPTNIMTNVNPFWAQSQFGGGGGPQMGMVNPTPPPPMYDVNQTGTFAQQVGASANAIGPSKGLGGTDLLGKMGGAAGLISAAGDIFSGIQDINAGKERVKKSEQDKRVSGVLRLASESREEPINRKYVRPEDVAIQPEQLFPTYGTGYNAAFSARNGSVLRAEDGMQIGGNLTEIQNMYNPGDLYSDLGFEPLNDSAQVKQYYGGGYIPQAQMGQSVLQNVGGFAKQMGKKYGTNSFKQFAGSPAGANFATQLGSYLGNPVTRTQSGGSKIGGAVLGTVGTALGGPIGGMIGRFAGNLAGGIFDTTDEQIAKNEEEKQKNYEGIVGQKVGLGLQNRLNSYMEHGGWVSHDWQPQVITHFGEHSMKSLLKPDPTMDTLRSGGHIRQNNMSPMDQYAMGGELQTTWGGYAKPMTYNHHLPGSGEITMFHGATHENGGIGVKYGNDGEYDPYTEYGKDGIESKTDVEVETREPAVQLPDTSSKNPQSKFALGGEDSDKNMSLNVYGNLTVDKDLYPDNPFIAKFHGKTYKKTVKDIALLTEKENKKIAKAQNELASLLQSGVISSYDKLKLDSLKLAMTGPDMKLKSFANAIQDLAIGQNATNETAEESGLDAKALSERKIKIDKEAMKQTAKWGKAIKKAQGGDKRELSKTTSLKEIPKGQRKSGQFYGKVTGDRFSELIENNKDWFDFTGFNPANKSDVERFQREFNKLSEKIGSGARLVEDGKLGEQTASARVDYRNLPGVTVTGKKPTIPAAPLPTSTTYGPGYIQQKPQFPWAAAANTLLPYLERPFQDEYVDLSPEMLAIATNQLEPVPAQLFQPQLKTPYDISLQDQLNEVTAQTRQAERLVGSDPAAVAAISAQANRAKSQILGEQMRLNQGLMDKTIGSNIDVLNQAKLLNQQTLAKQADLSSLAKSKTDETLRRAVGSIADKIQKSRLENRSLAVLQQTFPNYRLTGDMRFTPRGFTTFDTTVPGAFGMLPTTTVSRTTAPAQSAQATQPTVAQQIMQSTMPQNYAMAPQTTYQEPTAQELVEGLIGYAAPQPPSRASVLPPYGTSRKNGGKTKKDSRNSNIVRAMKNL